MSINQFITYGLIFVVLGVALTIGGKIISDVKAKMPANSTALTVADNAISGLQGLTSWLPLVALAVAGSIILGVVFDVFKVGGNSGGRGRKGEASKFITYGLVFVILGVSLTIGAKIVEDVKSQITDTNAQTIATNALQGLSGLTSWLPLVALAVAGSIILAVVFKVFGEGKKQ